MNNHSSSLSPNTIKNVEDVLASFKAKARFGLPGPIDDYEYAHPGTTWGGKRIHYWITMCGKKFGIRIFERASRASRKVLRDLFSVYEPPTLFIYSCMKLQTIAHRIADCLRTGLSRARRGLINCIKDKVSSGEVERCDNGNYLACGFRSASAPRLRMSYSFV